LDIRSGSPSDIKNEFLNTRPQYSLKDLQLNIAPQFVGSCLAHFLELESLKLLCSPISEPGLQHLARMPNLSALSLNGCPQVTSAALKHLDGLSSLKQLTLHDTPVDDAGLEHLKGLPKLERPG
jgi:hypothetical protein